MKNRKSARKVSSMHECFRNSNMQWEKSKKSRKAKVVESKYGICTDLPSARARHFESDERDLSLALIPLFGLSWRNGQRRSCDLMPHLFGTSFL